MKDFIKGTKDYYKKSNLNDILDELLKRDNVVPTLYLRRKKTDK